MREKLVKVSALRVNRLFKTDVIISPRTIKREIAIFYLTDACSYRLERTYFARKDV